MHMYVSYENRNNLGLEPMYYILNFKKWKAKSTIKYILKHTYYAWCFPNTVYVICACHTKKGLLVSNDVRFLHPLLHISRIYSPFFEIIQYRYNIVKCKKTIDLSQKSVTAYLCYDGIVSRQELVNHIMHVLYSYS